MPARALRVVFMGSPAFALPSLRALIETEQVIAVVTQPDKRAGRGLALAQPEVKLAAQAAGIPVLQPPSLRKPPFRGELEQLAPDLVVVVAYGKILPAELLAVPRFGCVNVHASLLPKYRGAAPAQWAIIRGERETGVTLMQMDAGMDTGPILLERRLPLDEQMTAGELLDHLAPIGAEVLKEGLEGLKAGRLVPRAQDEAQATLAPPLTRQTGRIEFERGARAVRDLARGCDPWPGAFTLLGGVELKLFRPKLISGSGRPGVVLGADRDGLWVGCGADAVAFGELQLPGRRRLAARAFLAGRPLAPGTQLG